MVLSDNDLPMPRVDKLAGEQGFALLGEGALATAEQLFGAGLVPGQALRRSWNPEAPPALLIVMAPDRIEIRVPDRQPWPERLAIRLAELTGVPGFSGLLAQAIARLETWQESDADSATSPEELAAELNRLRQLAPSVESGHAIDEALEALDDGLPADVVAAALYRARLALKTV